MAYVPRKGKSPDTIHKIRDELDTMLAGYESRTMQREAGLRNEELSEAASPGHVRATALVKQLQSDDVGDVESAVDQLVNLVQYMDIRKAMFDAGAIELLVDTGLAEIVLPEVPAMRLAVDEHMQHKDVYVHSLVVLEQAIERETDGPDLVLRLAALAQRVGEAEPVFPPVLREVVSPGRPHCGGGAW